MKGVHTLKADQIFPTVLLTFIILLIILGSVMFYNPTQETTLTITEDDIHESTQQQFLLLNDQKLILPDELLRNIEYGETYTVKYTPSKYNKKYGIVQGITD